MLRGKFDHPGFKFGTGGSLILADFRVVNSAKLKNPFVLTEGDLKPHVDAFVGVVNDFLHLTRHAIYFTDTVFSVKVYHLPPLMIATHHLDEPQLTCSLFSSQIAVIVWFIAIVGGAFSGIVLLYGSTCPSFASTLLQSRARSPTMSITRGRWLITLSPFPAST